MIEFAYLTRWRLTSEILPLEWRHVDWTGRVVRLDPGTTKNGEGRVAAIGTLLKAQQADHERLSARAGSCPMCFTGTGRASATSAAPG